MAPVKHDPKGKVRLKLKSEIKGSAVMSDCQRYRHRLERVWDTSLPTILWIGMNPSTADGLHDDPTCGREVDYSMRWGYGHYLKGNVLDWRATFPKDIPTDPTLAASKAGRKHLLEMAAESDLIMAAWGKLPPKLVGQTQEVVTLLHDNNFTLHCLNTNKDGGPTHPLYQKKDLTPKPWPL